MNSIPELISSATDAKDLASSPTACASKPPRDARLVSFPTPGRALLRRLWPFASSQRPSPTRGQDTMLQELAGALLSVKGEASGVSIASELLQRYGQAGDDDRRAFFINLATVFHPDEAAVAACWERYQSIGASALPALASAAESPRQELFRRLNLAPGGTAALVAMRADLLTLVDQYPSLAAVEADLFHLFQSWFNRGFLTMRSIDWASPASLLERIIRYEAVHDIKSWDDLRLRLEPEDRRCFAFFHPVMPDEPLIFVEVGLTTDMPDGIQAMLDPARPPIAAERATTATFYSINNCQPGLRGISFGHFLIKQVAADLKRDLPNLTCFVTLSPIPGLMSWLRKTVTDPEELTLMDWLGRPSTFSGDTGGDGLAAAARSFLLRRAGEYFLEARNAAGRPVDPVARFHLGNGARLERINWRADISPNGLRQSGSLMVNYQYDLPTIEKNHEVYVERGEVVTGAPFRKAIKQVAA